MSAIAAPTLSAQEEAIESGKTALHGNVTDRVLWTTEIDGKEVRYHREPAIGLGRRFAIGILRLLPIQNEL